MDVTLAIVVIVLNPFVDMVQVAVMDGMVMLRTPALAKEDVAVRSKKLVLLINDRRAMWYMAAMDIDILIMVIEHRMASMKVVALNEMRPTARTATEGKLQPKCSGSSLKPRISLAPQAQTCRWTRRPSLMTGAEC